MDDVREEMEQANEISQAIGQPIDGQEFDDEELLGELNELEELDLEEQMLSEPGASLDMPDAAMPSAPKGGLQPAKAAEEDEDEKALRELEASLAM